MPRFCFCSKFARVISQSRINWKSTFFPLKNYKSALLKLAQKSPQTTASGSVPRSWGGPRTSWRTARCPPAKCKPIAPARSRATSRTSLSGEQAARLRGAAREGCPPLPPQKKKREHPEAGSCLCKARKCSTYPTYSGGTGWTRSIHHISAGEVRSQCWISFFVEKVQNFIWSLFSTSTIDFKAAGRGRQK